MGDRGNIIVTDKYGETTSRVVLYSHWGGCRLPQTLRTALQRGKSRWDDSQYLARIIFSQILAGPGITHDGRLIRTGNGEVISADKLNSILEELFGTTGYGISSEVGDNEHLFIVVDVDGQEVRYQHGPEEPDQAVAKFTFAQFADDATDIAGPYSENDEPSAIP